jgi:3-isopropylmalate/(R)-2-methylmalate dehydratase small subunit
MSDPFTTLTAIAAPLMRINIDTDAIIPSREMKRVSKAGLGEGLFAPWRYVSPDSREENPEFVLNRDPYRRAKILLGGENFGCGSSREHAVWALAEWGIRAIIAPSFGAIFFGNCVRNGIVPVVIDNADIEVIARWVKTDPANHPVSVSLEEMQIEAADMTRSFTLEDADREMLIDGLDAIDVTLKHIEAIEAFETDYRQRNAWAVVSVRG